MNRQGREGKQEEDMNTNEPPPHETAPVLKREGNS
jgi:hypothetical protein